MTQPNFFDFYANGVKILDEYNNVYKEDEPCIEIDDIKAAIGGKYQEKREQTKKRRPISTQSNEKSDQFSDKRSYEHIKFNSPTVSTSEISSPINKPIVPKSEFRSPINKPIVPKSEFRSPVIKQIASTNEIRSPIAKTTVPTSEFRSPINKPIVPKSEFWSPVIKSIASTNEIRSPIAPTSEFRSPVIKPIASTNEISSPIVKSSFEDIIQNFQNGKSRVNGKSLTKSPVVKPERNDFSAFSYRDDDDLLLDAVEDLNQTANNSVNKQTKNKLKRNLESDDLEHLPPKKRFLKQWLTQNSQTNDPIPVVEIDSVSQDIIEIDSNQSSDHKSSNENSPKITDFFSKQKSRPSSQTPTTSSTADNKENQNCGTKFNFFKPPEISKIQVDSRVQNISGYKILVDKYSDLFEEIQHFNEVQILSISPIFESNDSLIIKGPTGSGKSTVLEFSIIKLLNELNSANFKVLFIDPAKVICTEKYK